MATVTLTIDGTKVTVKKGTTLLVAAEEAGIKIPNLCHDPRVKPFGACRLCFVEIDGMPKPVTACTTQATDGMMVRTDSNAITRLRRFALELLLAYHYGDCIAPCQLACPAGIDIQGFIAYLANGYPGEAARLIREKLPFPSSVGRVCPRFCEDECRRNLVDKPVAICTLKQYAGDRDAESGESNPATPLPETGKRVAIVGAGPAGLTAAYYLRLMGHQVTVFEAEKEAGGMLRYGIPEYRLPKEVLNREIEEILGVGIDLRLQTAMGKDFTMETLRREGYKAVFIGIGAQLGRGMRLEGGDSSAVVSALEFLKDPQAGTVKTGDRVVVVGGGNTAIDAARTAVRLGAGSVTIVYRRTEKEMPAAVEEIAEAREEGVAFQFLANPTRYLDAEKRLELIKMTLGEPDASGRRRPVPLENSEFFLPADRVVLAIGQVLDETALRGEIDKNQNVTGESLLPLDGGWIQADPGTMATSLPGVFAGGDCVSGPATVVEAVAAGRKAALAIGQYLRDEPVTGEAACYNCQKGSLEELDPAEFQEFEKKERVTLEFLLSVAERKKGFAPYQAGLTPEQARYEAQRCLACGCNDVFNCRLRELATAYGIDEQQVKELRPRARTWDGGALRQPVDLSHPHIAYDPNKCILCGLCVRTCSEAQGSNALNFLHRGLATTILAPGRFPAAAACESCGLCVVTCPTGALSNKTAPAFAKPGPWQTRKTPVICPHCGVGCSLTLQCSDGRVTETSVPATGGVNNGLLCVKGAYHFSAAHKERRLEAPLLRVNGALQETTWEEALATVARTFTGLAGNYGPESIAFFVAPNVTNETALLTAALARGLGTNNLFTTPGEGWQRFLECRQGDFDTLAESDFILLYRATPTADYPVLARQIKKTAENGSWLGIMHHRTTALDPVAQAVLRADREDCLRLLAALARAGSAPGATPEAALPGVEGRFRKKLTAFTAAFRRAKRPAVVCDTRNLNWRELQELQKLISAHASATLLPLVPWGNIYGLQKMGIGRGSGRSGELPPGAAPFHPQAAFTDARARAILAATGQEACKGLLIVADEGKLPDTLCRPGLFTVAITPFYREELAAAGLLLPGTAYPETRGSYLNSEGRLQWTAQALTPPGGKENWQILLELAEKMGIRQETGDFQAIAAEVQRLAAPGREENS
ncbi:MAG TPA: FAD-dependent oxidoreductase [Firmicutes bacterium]|nr:FAD-dependent oxidoreductase [Bacillota bacterium]